MGSQELDRSRRGQEAVLHISWQCIELGIELIVKLDRPPADGERIPRILEGRCNHLLMISYKNDYESVAGKGANVEGAAAG